MASLRDRLAGLCKLGPEAAERVVRPLFDVVKIVAYMDLSSVSSGLRTVALCTTRRFGIEQGRAIGRALHDLPASADPRLHALAAIRDDAERNDVFTDQRLYQAADDAGLSINFASGRYVHLGCTDLAALLALGGASPSGNPVAAALAIKSVESLPNRAEAEQRFLRDWGLELPDSIFRFQAFVDSLDPGARRALMDLELCPWGIMDVLAAPDSRPRDGVYVRVPGRYYRDPPEFLTFMHGGSDGLHYGLWFDDGRTCAGVASYYNNDGWAIQRTAGTPLEAVRATPELRWRNLSDHADEEDISERQSSLGLLRDALTAFETGDRPEVGLAYSEMYDFTVGRARVRTLDGGGALVTGETTDHPYSLFRDDVALQASVAEARRRCAEGDPAEALVLGRDLHWESCGNPVREAYANELLVMAYHALGRPALAEIADAHHRHRDLPQVDVLR